MLKHRKLFPYTNRRLGLSSVKVPRSHAKNPATIAQLAISNMVEGDELTLGHEHIVILSINDEQIEYKSSSIEREIIRGADVCNSSLANMVEACLRKSYPDYTDPICEIIERDPAVFRLRTGLGWIVNDDLCLASGNIRYSSTRNSREVVTSSDDDTPFQRSFF